MNFLKKLQFRGPLFSKYLLTISLFGLLIRLIFALILPLDGGDEAFQLLITRKPLIPMILGTISAWPPIWQVVLHYLNLITHDYIYFQLVTAFIGAIPVNYSFPLNLAQLTNFYPYYQLNPVNTVLISLAVFATLLAIYGLFSFKKLRIKQEKNSKELFLKDTL